jgi:hypothetical protein
VTGDDIAFVYANMRNAFVGSFEGKKMVKAAAAKITHTR